MGINVTILKTKIEEFTNFYFEGNHIQLPYYWGGKHSISSIESNLVKICDSRYNNLSKNELQEIVTRNYKLCGVDCSGFVLRVANESSNTNEILKYFSNVAYQNDRNFPINAGKEYQYAYGISANLLTNAKYSKKLTDVRYMQPGDFIRFENGKHIGIIKEINHKDINGFQKGIVVTYSHSSENKGPHDADVYLSSLNRLNLSDGEWNDWNTGYSQIIKNLFNYVCRPNL